jgi:hypothetical protein
MGEVKLVSTHIVAGAYGLGAERLEESWKLSVRSATTEKHRHGNTLLRVGGLEHVSIKKYGPLTARKWMTTCCCYHTILLIV